MTRQSSEEIRAIQLTAERQIRCWLMGQEVQRRLTPERAVAQLSEEVHSYVAISREVGASGGTIARMVSAELGFECLDREILTYIAEQYNLPKTMIEFVDEKTSSRLLELFGHWLHGRIVTQDEYLTRLGKIVLLAARSGNAVFVGRGVQFILPRDKGFAVRVIAPFHRRVETMVTRLQFDRSHAEAYVRKHDRGRRDFIRHHFHRDPADPTLYDLVVNLERLEEKEAADLIVTGFRGHFGRRPEMSVAPQGSAPRGP